MPEHAGRMRGLDDEVNTNVVRAHRQAAMGSKGTETGFGTLQHRRSPDRS